MPLHGKTLHASAGSCPASPLAKQVMRDREAFPRCSGVDRSRGDRAAPFAQLVRFRQTGSRPVRNSWQADLVAQIKSKEPSNV